MIYMKKNIIAVIVAVLLIMLPITVSAYDDQAVILLDGSDLDTYALIDDTNVFLPVRDVCQALGYEVVWTDVNGVRKITVSNGDDTVELDLTHQLVTDNGHQFSAVTNTGSGILLVSSRTYIDSGLFSTVFPADTDYNTYSGRVMLERRNDNNITIVTEKLSSVTGYLKAALQYPQLEGLSDTAAQDAVNKVLKQVAQNALETGQKNASAMGSSIRDGYTGAVGKCETVFDYMVTYNQNDLFSVVMMEYQYVGGAHGSTFQNAYTFELATGAVLPFSVLMDDSVNYSACINAYIRGEIDRRVENGDLYEFEYSPFADIGIEPGFYLADNALVIFFQEYEYFPYTAGIQEFAVPYYNLNGMFSVPYSFLGGSVVTLDSDSPNTLSAGEYGQSCLKRTRLADDDTLVYQVAVEKIN